MGKGEFDDRELDKKEYHLATVTYVNGQQMGRLYASREEAEQFAEEQRALPNVKSVKVEAIDREEQQRLRKFDVNGPTTIQ